VYEALLREPLIYTKLDACSCGTSFSAVVLATDGEVSEMDLAMVPDPATRPGSHMAAAGSAIVKQSRSRSQEAEGKGLHAARARRSSAAPYDSAAAEFEAERALEQSGESTLVGYYNSKEMLEYASGRVRETQGNDQRRGMRTAGRWWRTFASIPGTRRSRAGASTGDSPPP